MVKPPLHTLFGTLGIAALAITLISCSSDDATSGTIPVSEDAVLNVVPGDPGWQPVQPPDQSICIGMNPGPEAWALSRAIAEAAAEAAAMAEADTSDGDTPTNREEVVEAADTADDDATTESDATFSPGFDFPPLPDPEPESGDPPADDELSDPCVPDYQAPSDCIGVEAPAFAAYDFQPQSCGYGATYGLELFKGRVTFVALLASW